MSCDAIRAAMAGYDACESGPGGARIATHCLYPSFEPVYVYVYKDGDGYTVHDGMGAFHSAWEHGRDERAIVKSISFEAAHFHLALEKHRLEARNVPVDWLRPTILAVANASAAAANSAVAKVVAAADDDLVAKIGDILSRTIAPSRIARDFVVRGASGGDRSIRQDITMTLIHHQSGTSGTADAWAIHPDGKHLVRINDHWFMRDECVEPIRLGGSEKLLIRIALASAAALVAAIAFRFV